MEEFRERRNKSKCPNGFNNIDISYNCSALPFLLDCSFLDSRTLNHFSLHFHSWILLGSFGLFFLLFRPLSSGSAGFFPLLFQPLFPAFLSVSSASCAVFLSVCTMALAPSPAESDMGISAVVINNWLQAVDAANALVEALTPVVKNIFLMTGYRLQAKTLRERAKVSGWYQSVKICTIDFTRGQEWEVVILSLVKTTRADHGFIGTLHRANVACSRHRTATLGLKISCHIISSTLGETLGEGVNIL